MVKRFCNNITKRFFIAFVCLIALTAQAKQVTITPVRGSRWFLRVEELGYLRVAADSLIIYRNTGEEAGREALVDIRRIAVEQSVPTAIQRASFPITGRKVLEPDGQIVILQGKRRYGIDGLKK